MTRPFFGEKPAAIHAPRWSPPAAYERRTLDEWRELKISDGVCPMPGCGGMIDTDFFCTTCGHVSLPGGRTVPIVTSWSALDDDQLSLGDAA